MNDDDKAHSGESSHPMIHGDQDPHGPNSILSLKLAEANAAPLALPLSQQNAIDAQTASERALVAKAHSFRLDTRQAAKYIGVCKRTLEYWRDQGIGPPYLRIGRHVWYELPSLARWLADRIPGSGSLGPPSPPGPTEIPEASHPIGNLTRTQAAQYLGICVRTLDYWRGQPGKPQPMDNGTKRVRYSIAALDAWLKEQTHGA